MQLPIKDIAKSLRMSVAEHEARVLWCCFADSFGIFLRERLDRAKLSEAARQKKIDFPAAWKSLMDYQTSRYNTQKLSEVMDGKSTHVSQSGNDVAKILAVFGKEETVKLILELLMRYDHLRSNDGKKIWPGWSEEEEQIMAQESKEYPLEGARPPLSLRLRRCLEARRVGLH